MKNVRKSSDSFAIALFILVCGNGFVATLPTNAQADPAKANPPKVTKQKLIKISEKTTRVLGPLDEEGYVDYTAAINEILSKGVTPDNNGAVQFWQALGSAQIPPDDRKQFFKTLGVEVPPAKGLPLTWGEYAREELDLPAEIQAAGEAMLVNARERPWKRGEFPQIEAWIDAQKDRFKLVAIGVRKERFYQPLIISPGEGLINVELPGAIMSREVARGLQARAMLHLGEGRLDAALTDIETMRHLARHIGAGATIIENLIGIAIESMACQGYVNLVQQQRPAPNKVPELLAKFNEFKPMPKMTDSLNLGERFLFLETSQNLARHGAKETGLPALANNPIMAAVLKSMINWNIPMEDANAYYDRLVEVGNIESVVERRKMAILLETENEDYLRKNARPSPFQLLTGNGRGKAIGNILKALLLPAISAALDAEYRVGDYQELCRLATALEGYRTQHGTYPDSLEKLVPKYIEKLPMDTFTDGKKPFRYEAEGEAFILYGLSHNTIDDGGVRNADLVIQGPLDWKGVAASRRAAAARNN